MRYPYDLLKQRDFLSYRQELFKKLENEFNFLSKEYNCGLIFLSEDGDRSHTNNFQKI